LDFGFLLDKSGRSRIQGFSWNLDFVGFCQDFESILVLPELGFWFFFGFGSGRFFFGQLDLNRLSTILNRTNILF
jgi:hypothetical protein